MHRLANAGLICCCLAASACDDEELAEPPVSALSVPGDLPAIAYCDPVRQPSNRSIQLEAEMLEALFAIRQRGADCGERGRLPPTTPLEPSAELWCAARVHALSMLERQTVSHQGDDGELAWDRIRQAGYPSDVADEMIALTESDPAQLLEDTWLRVDGSCEALVAPEFVNVGVGALVVPEDQQSDFTERDTSGLVLWSLVIALPR